MEDDCNIAANRSKRQKIDKHGRFAALEKFKQLKGQKNKYVVSEITNVYEEVDEREYSKKVLERQDDDWIVDDGGGGYVEDGREIFDDDLDEESVAQSAKRKSKNSKKQPSEKGNKSSGNIRTMLATMPSKKKTTEMKAEADKLLEDLMEEIDTKPEPKKEQISSKDYLKTFNSNKGVVNETTPTRGISLNRTAVKRQRSPDLSCVRPLPESRRSILSEQQKKPVIVEDSEDKNVEISRHESPIKISNHETSLNVTSEVIEIDEPSFVHDDFLDDCENTPSLPSKDNVSTPTENAVEAKEVVCDSWQDESWNIKGDVTETEAVVTVDTSVLPLVSSEEGTKVFRFFWWDAYEDPFKQPGVVFLFGKVYVETAKTYVSCCVAVKNVPRRVFLLPREKKKDLTTQREKDELVTPLDVYQEFNEKIANANKIMSFKSRKVVRKYAFELADVPAESEYLEIKYPAAHPRLPANLEGETFSKVFGSNTSALEILLLERKIKGPCWLEVQAPQSLTPCSWCKVEVTCSKPEDLSVSAHVAPPPPITVMAVNIRTSLNARNMENEVIMISCLVHTKYMVSKPAPNPGFEQHFCAFTHPSDVPWPFNLKKETTAYKGTRLHQHESERSLLGFFLTKVFLLDPDLIVGHDLYGFTLDTLIHRIENHKVPNWSRLGRLKRSIIPQMKGKSAERNLASGRLVCDTMISARELIRARSYDLDSLCKQVLRVPDDKRQDLTMEEVKAKFSHAGSLISLINATMQDTSFVLKIMYELNVMPMALQITNIAGNLMARTLLGGRSERNEYLLLHAFTEKDYIVPDKIIGKRKVADEEGTGVKSSKKKPEYAGGLVLDPKKGFYDKFILLMDFNSLYPSIIQEYNICFTTVSRTENSEEEPELPAQGLPMGILPIEIRKLVESRRQVKSLMKAPDLSADQKMQYNIRQTALKLTANSMYGCLGFSYSRFYAKPLAALITSRGREILMNTKDIVQRMNYDVIYGDTDSIMINSNCVDYDQVFSIGNKIKQEINKLYKHVELEVDGVFKFMLLLKKKKYAAIVLNKKPNGELLATQEYKGLDIVRRDWSQISAEIGRFVLNQILSDGSQEERIATIRSHLEKVAADLRAGQVPTSLLAISKQLAKNPEDYPDRKSLPHLQVAMRINARGGKKLKAGDTISYVICDDGSNQAAVQRAYHVDELKGAENLMIDVQYYLSQQIHPVVSRLCEPIDGLDAAFIAECLGLDPTSYRRAAAQRSQAENNEDDDEYRIIDDKQTYRHCEKFSFICVNESCKTTIFMDGPMHDNYFVLSRCRNPSCKTAPIEYLPCIQNTLQLTMRSYILKLYENWMICEDPACPNRTRRVPMQFVNSFPVCSLCRKGLMYKEYSDSDLFYQLKYFAHMFNTKSMKQIPPALESAYKLLHAQVSETLQQSAYQIVDLGKLFKFLGENTRSKIKSASQRSIIDSQKKWSNI